MTKKLFPGKNSSLNKINLKIALLILAFIPEIFSQEVIVNLQAPPPYQMRIEDMWNLVLINQGNATEIYLHGTATELVSGLIVDVSTSVFTLPKGTKRIRSADVGTITINQSNENYSSVINRLSALPNGSYEICIEVIRAQDGSVIGSECLQQEVLNLSQITLVYPEDNSNLNFFAETEEDTTNLTAKGIEKKDIRRGMVIAKPGSISPHYRIASSSLVFSWLPPVPLPLNLNVTYRIKIVEMYPNQSSYDAMNSNPLFFTQSDIRNTSFVYPVGARIFNPENTYAWQIEAYSGKTLLASSEIYTFFFSSTSRRLLESMQDEIKGFESLIRASNSTDEYLPEGLRITHSQSFATTSASLRNYSLNNFIIYEPAITKLFIPESRSESAVTFGIRAEMFGETSNRKGTGSERKPTFGHTLISPSVSLYGVPFGLNALISSENSTRRQNINSISFYYDLEEAKRQIKDRVETEGEENLPCLMKFFSYFNTFGIGTNYPSYTAFTMQGAPVSGLSFEFNPDWFYLAAALQRNQKPIDSVAFRRDIYSGRIGFGQRDDSHIILTGLYAVDQANSIITDSINRTLTPNSNYVFGIDGRLNLFENSLSIDGEVTAAMLTRDNRDPELVNEDIPQFVRDIFQPKVSSQVDYAYSLKTTYNNSNSATKISAGVRMIGPGYKTLGNPTLRNDRLEIEGKFDQKILNRQISFSIFTKYSHDNLINSKRFRTKTFSPGLNLSLRFKDYPYFNLGYMPSFMKNDAVNPNDIVDFKNHLITSSIGYNFKVNKVILNSNLGYIFNKATSLDTAQGYTANTILLNESIIFDSPLTISLSAGVNFLNYTNSSNQNLTFDGNIGYLFFERWNNIIGAGYSIEKSNSNKLYLYYNTSYNLSENIELDLIVEKNFFKDQNNSANDYNEIIARSNIKLKF